MADDLDGGDLGEVGRRVVLPVIHALFAEDELDVAEIRRGPPPGHSPDGADPATEVWLQIVARGEVFAARLTNATNDLWNAESVAASLADSLEDWLCETGFAWGQRRTAHYVVPS